MLKNSKKYTAVIIGAGRIAAGFDNPKSKAVLTHAHAFTNHPKVELVGFYDTDFTKAKAAAKQWSVKAFKSLSELQAEVQPDIISICTPDNHHFKSLQQAAEFKPRLIVAEKPLTTNLKDSQKIIKLLEKEKIPVLVNYSRRFDLTTQKIKTDLDQGKYGKVLAATGIYGKGILHNGSHLVDWARYLFGEVLDSRAFFTRSDYDSASDKTIGGFMSFEKCSQFYLVAADERCYSIFELDIFCEKGRIHFTDSGLFITQQKTIKDPLYKGYTILEKSQVKPTQLDKSLVVMVENAVNYLEHGEPLVSTLANAYRTQLACSKLLKN